jgi:hypothetical protein
MILETFLVLGVLFILGILFYRQAIEEYSWSQIELDQVSELPKLLGERKPVVVRSVGEPKLFTPDVLRGNGRLQGFPLISGTTLGSFLESGDKVPLEHPLSEPVRRALALESGLQVWAEHTWFSRILPVSWLEFLYKLQAYAHIGKEGLTKTTARTTVIYPTSGKLEVTLLNESKGKLFPTAWKGRHPETFTIQDTPLVGEIKYITIVVRPGSVLCVPPHWYVSVSCPPNAFWATFELHDPFSLLAKSVQ